MTDFVLALTGPAGAGKTTTGEKVAKSFPRCVNIDADHIKHMIVSGFYVDESNPENPDGWGFNEWGLVGDSIGLLAANFISEGYDVIINGYIDEPAWSRIEKHVKITHKVMLLPQVETSISRDAARQADILMGESAVTKHHNTFSNDAFYDGFQRLDTTAQSVEKTVQTVLGIIS